jgi:hypothetical protein
MRRTIAVACVFLLGAGLYGGNAALAQRSALPAKNGVWFQVKAAIKPVPKVEGEGGDKSEPRGSLSVQLRISAHAVGSNYYGHPTQNFDFKLSEGSAEKIYWQDTACHIRRGLPKVSVVAVDGTLERGGKTIDVKARPRHIGLKLPDDELSSGSRLRRGLEEGRQFFSFQAGTKTSKLGIVVRIYTVDCTIDQAGR